MAGSSAVFTPSTDPVASAAARAMATVGQLVGVSLESPMDEVYLTQKGVPPVALDSLKQLGATPSELSWIIKPRTLAHRKSKKESLTTEETGRWLRAAKVQALALEVFGNQDKATAWLHKTRKAFGNQSAMELLPSEAGAQLVEEMLNQIDAGYFA